MIVINYSHLHITFVWGFEYRVAGLFSNIGKKIRNSYNTSLSICWEICSVMEKGQLLVLLEKFVNGHCTQEEETIITAWYESLAIYKLDPTLKILIEPIEARIWKSIREKTKPKYQKEH
ncbi:hypothetical protein H8S90_14050 [Olivibacter sp. SDN3]|uniref:hypothetical protein n=1 Tax=Olivibacter sp. SDN3 TaxID=2764720 RepID=UPI001651494E|nr:hypothetical protein [Olivibacter sp. SDN3]QNL47938.1 hypothetical protein H8S90_14050 [Olivibacter sp. SDN3]